MRPRPWGRDRASGHGVEPGVPRRSLVVALVLASVTLMVLDRGGAPVLDPAREAAGRVFGPAEAGTASAVRPITDLPGLFRSRSSYRDEVASLQAANQRLASQVRTAPYQRARLAELDGLTQTAQDLGYALVPARVVGIGASQSFSSTVTIDAGARSGLSADMTVVNGDGLVGRVLRVTPSTATVLLITDADSTVGARVGESMEMGFLHGRDQVGRTGRLDLDLVDESVVPRRHATVVTWGSQGTGPYVSGVPIGQVSSVYRSLRDSSQRALIDPYVDFSALDLVGVIVPSGTRSDRAVIEADGSIR